MSCLCLCLVQGLARWGKRLQVICFEWCFCMQKESCCCSSQPFFHLPPGSLVLSPHSWIFLWMCDDFCNKSSLMCRISGVSGVLSWVEGKECKVCVCVLIHFFGSPISYLIILNTDVSLRISLSLYRHQSIFYLHIFLMYSIYTPLRTFCPTPTALKPIQNISCSRLQSSALCEMLTDERPQRTERQKHFDFDALWRKKKGSVEWGKVLRSLIWWMFLTQTGKKVSADGGADVCVSKEVCFPTIHPALTSNNRCKPRLQNGSGGRKITCLFYLLLHWTPWRWDSLPAIVWEQAGY